MTPRMLLVLNVLEEFWDRNGYGPTYRELAARSGIRSVGNIAEVIKQLEEAGYVTRRKNRNRSVKSSRKVDRKMSSGVHS